MAARKTAPKGGDTGPPDDIADPDELIDDDLEEVDLADGGLDEPLEDDLDEIDLDAKPAPADETKVKAAPPPPSAFDEDDAIIERESGDDDDVEGLRDDEFICISCYLAKNVSQRASGRKNVCRDCA